MTALDEKTAVPLSLGDGFPAVLDLHGGLPDQVFSFLLKLVVIVLASLILLRVIQGLGRQLKDWMIRSRIVRAEDDKRIATLMALVYSVACWVVAVLAVLLILNEMGINIAPFLVGASVFGAAVAFGTQNLIKDLIYGFLIVAENQFVLGDWIQAGGVTGRVEQMSFRRVVLRDELGRSHILPNSEISKVTRLSVGPDQFDVVPLEVGFQYLSFPQVQAVLEKTSQKLCRDQSDLVLEPLGAGSIKTWGGGLTRVTLMAKVAKGAQWKLFRALHEILPQVASELHPEGAGRITLSLRTEQSSPMEAGA